MWNIIRYILDGVLIFLTIYFYIENRKLKGFEIEKNIKLGEAEFEELNNQYEKEVKDFEKQKRVLSSEISGQSFAEIKNKYDSKFKKLAAEQQYLEKLKKYKWIFSKSRNWDLNKK